MNSKNDCKLSKIVTLGDAGAGKTTLLRKFVSGQFDDHSCGISAAFFSKFMEPSTGAVASVPRVQLQLWDTAGQERYRSLGPIYFRGAEVVLFIFDVSCQQSFDALPSWVNFVRDQCCSTAPLICIVAAKCDKPRLVSSEEAQRFANQINAPYFETSSKQDVGVNELFQCVTDTVAQFPEYSTSNHMRIWNGAKYSKREGSVRLPVQGEVVPHRGGNGNWSFSSC